MVQTHPAGRAVRRQSHDEDDQEQAEAQIDPSGEHGDGLVRDVDAVRRASGDDGLLFSLPDGRPAERVQFRRLWLRAARRAGWPMKSPTVAAWHPHDLRRVAACWMLFDVRVDPTVASRMLGHANPAFTLSRYVGVRAGADAATDALTENW